MNAQTRSIWLAAAATAVCLILGGLAQPAPAEAQVRSMEITLRELQTFDNFLDSHPAIDKDLRQNPALATDSAYLAAHPEVKTFLQTHPGVQGEISKSPRFFVRRVEAFDRSHKDVTLAEVRSFDAFLDENPIVDSDLKKDPALVRNATYLSGHQDLQDYLKKHPAVAADLRESPRAFMWRERMLDQRQDRTAQRGALAPRATAPRATAPRAATAPQRPNLPARSGIAPANRGLRSGR